MTLVLKMTAYRSHGFLPPLSASYRIGGQNQKTSINFPWYPAVRVQSLGVFGVHDLCTKVIF